MNKTTLLEQIKRTRKSKGLTQAELAERLGKSEMTIRRWESEERSPRMEEVQKIAQVFNISVSELLSDTTEEKGTSSQSATDTVNSGRDIE